MQTRFWPLKNNTNNIVFHFVIFQLFSKSTADGLELYQPHVDSLKDANATIEFTRKINNLFDLLNSRVPKDGIWMHSKQDKLKVMMETVFDIFIDLYDCANCFSFLSYAVELQPDQVPLEN